jgi:hypothetical protein
MEEPGPEKFFELSPAALAQRWKAGLLDMDHALNLISGDLHQAAVKAIIMKVPAGGRILWATEHLKALYVVLGSCNGLTPRSASDCIFG